MVAPRNWDEFAAGLFYPHFALLGLIVAALLVAYGATSLVDLVLPLSNVTTGIITVGFVVVLVRAAQPLLRQAYVYHLMDDWIFNRQNALGKRPDFDTRLDQFARRIVAAVLEGDAQEILDRAITWRKASMAAWLFPWSR